MAKKPEADAKDEKGLSLADIIRLGKSRELNFVAAVGKGGAAIVGDLRKSGNALWNLAKEKNEGISRAKSVSGRLTINGKELNLSLDEEEIPGALKKQMKKTLKEAGMPMKIIFRLPGGQTEEESEEDDAEEPAADGAAAPDGPAGGAEGSSAAMPNLDQIRAQLDKEFGAISADFDRIVAEGAPAAARKAEQLGKMFHDAKDGPDPTRAMPILRLLGTFVAGELIKVGKMAAPAGGAVAQSAKMGGGKAAMFGGGAEGNPFAGDGKGAFAKGSGPVSSAGDDGSKAAAFGTGSAKGSDGGGSSASAAAAKGAASGDYGKGAPGGTGGEAAAQGGNLFEGVGGALGGIAGAAGKIIGGISGAAEGAAGAIGEAVGKMLGPDGKDAGYKESAGGEGKAPDGGAGTGASPFEAAGGMFGGIAGAAGKIIGGIAGAAEGAAGAIGEAVDGLLGAGGKAVAGAMPGAGGKAAGGTGDAPESDTPPAETGPGGTGEAPGSVPVPDAGPGGTGEAPGSVPGLDEGQPEEKKAEGGNDKSLSGRAWFNANQSKYPNSKSVDDLSSTFKPKVVKFIKALETAGATVSITATLRSAARAEIMYYCWQVGVKGMKAADVPKIDGVDITWDHGDEEASKKGAKEMYDAFGMTGQVAKPGKSNHLTGNAIDMNISWTGTLKIKDGEGNDVEIDTTPTDETNTDLQALGATYGCKNGAKTLSEPWHWSPTGN
ncbi:MAG: D-alanyl-D-alanine carboxypeptidase family protein [Paracoccaceae bacterium]|nr:MAG: D-alanyl-D-alanine carboxypeptidase family protein [Paracoccaceae bacterium]